MGTITHFFLLMTDVTEKIREITSNLLADKEIELAGFTYKREGPRMVLRLTLDKKGGITLDECGWVNASLSELLDKEDILKDRYVLEVCSPGLDRHLKTKKDFDKVTGEMVKINTYGPIEDKREHAGKVVNCDEEFVTVELKSGGKTIKIPLDKISKARLEIEF